MFKKLLKFFDKLEDKIRTGLSKFPVVYAFIGSVGIILLWRGIWMLGDELGLSSLASIIVGTLILLATGLFVSFFIGEQIIISGIKEEKRIDEKTEEEIREDHMELGAIKDELDEIKQDIADIKEEVEEDQK